MWSSNLKHGQILFEIPAPTQSYELPASKICRKQHVSVPDFPRPLIAALNAALLM